LSEVDDYYTYDDEEEDIEICDYTGEECFGNKMFCEECPIMTEPDEEEIDEESLEKELKT
jgi:hypothetical protein